MELQLPPAFSSAPSRPARYILRFESDHAPLHLLNFYSMYAAKAFLDLATEPDDIDQLKWISSTHAITPSGTVIKSDHLEDIVEHVYSTEEKKYILPMPYPTFASKILGREVEPPVNPVGKEIAKAAVKRRKSATVKAERARQRALEAPLGAGDLALLVGAPAHKVRRVLRVLCEPRPYEWSNQEELEAIAAKIRPRLK